MALRRGGRTVAATGFTQRTVSQALIDALAARGMKNLYGLPGGGSSLDLMDAARARGIGFVLARHECAAMMMAATEAEISGGIAAAIATKGPGTANGTNGVAHASLDRAPVAFITDGFTSQQLTYITHQVFDQRTLLSPLVKAHSRLESSDPGAEISTILGKALCARQGPVHIELTGATARAMANAASAPMQATPAAAKPLAVTAARRVLGKARRPVVVVGLEARGASAETLRFIEALGCPALVTYKAKGVVPDAHPQFAGIFTCGAAEQPVVTQADLVVLVGVDPVEFILQPWPYASPVLEVGFTRHPVHYVVPAASLYGDIAANLGSLQAAATPGIWSLPEIASLRAAMLTALQYRGRRAGLAPDVVVKAAATEAAALRIWPRATVDAGAHMFSATAFWPCAKPNDLMISNGLASMGYALPAAIASAALEPRRAAIAFTGDGGLMMCLGELATAAERRAPIIVVVFNDGALSLIDIKQQQRRLPVHGVRWRRPDFAAVARGLGGKGFRVSTLAGYRRALRTAFAGTGLALIDVVVDPSGYQQQLAALRG